MSESGKRGNIVGVRVDAGTVDIEEGKTGSARLTKQRALHVNVRDDDGNEVFSASSPGPVILYDANGDAITSTDENSDNALDVHVSNSTIEQSTDVAHNDLNICVGGKDTDGNVQPLAVTPTGGIVTDGPILLTKIDVASNITYIGKATPGTATSAASWQIKRITDTSGDFDIEWADGDGDFDNIYDNRAALSYS